MRYIKKILLGLDQFGNTIIGGAPDETISARTGRRKDAGTLPAKLFWKPLAAILNKLDSGHTDGAICSERSGSQQDPAYRDVYDPEDACGGRDGSR